MGVQQHLVILICIYLMTNDLEHLFMCLLAFCISSFVKCLNFIFFISYHYYWVIRCLYGCQIPFCYITFCKYSLSTCGVYFHFLKGFFQRAEVLHFDQVQFSSLFSYSSLCFCVLSLSLPSPRVSKIFLLCFLLEDLQFQLLY